MTGTAVQMLHRVASRLDDAWRSLMKTWALVSATTPRLAEVILGIADRVEALRLRVIRALAALDGKSA